MWKRHKALLLFETAGLWAPGCFLLMSRQVICIHSVCSLSYDRSIASPKRVLHREWSRTSPFNSLYAVLSLRSSSSCLHLLPRPTVTSILPSIFPSVMCFRRQFLHKMWPIQLTSFSIIQCRILLSSLTLCNTSSFLIRSAQQIFSILFQHHT